MTSDLGETSPFGLEFSFGFRAATTSIARGAAPPPPPASVPQRSLLQHGAGGGPALPTRPHAMPAAAALEQAERLSVCYAEQRAAAKSWPLSPL